MKLAVVLFFMLSFSLSALSQDFEYGKPTDTEWAMKKYDKDTAAHAVVLREYGMATISTAETLPVIFEYHVRIKILDNKGFESGKASIELYHGEKDNIDRARLIHGETMFKDANGAIKKTLLKDDDIQRVKVNAHYDDVRFTLPDLKPGCIVEYTYQVEKPYHDKFHTWDFQSDIPKIHSEYETTIPAMLEYRVLLRGPLKFTSKKTRTLPQAFKFYDFTADCINTVYKMDDVPAFTEEEYMTAAENYRSALYFEILMEAENDNFVNNMTREWKDVDNTLKYHEKFGEQINHISYIKKTLPADLFTITDTLAKAKAIYTYLQKRSKWNNFVTIYCIKGIEKTLDDNTGNAGEINITLVAALTAAGINTDAVLTSTREHGIIDKAHPVIASFDYVVARVTIDGHSYLLDATDPLLSFGMVPLRCINGQGRVINMNKPSYWIDMAPDQKRTTASTINLAIQADGKIKGTIINYSLDQAAYEKRRSFKSFASKQEYIDSINKAYPLVKILKADIEGIDSLDQAITETYEIEMRPISDPSSNIMIDPSFWEKIGNPFNLAQRIYPVDMGFGSKNTLSVIISYPLNYGLTNQALSFNTSMPGGSAAYISNLTVDPGMIKYSQVMKLSKPIYQPDEYLYLKEFYNKIIQSQKVPIVFKKKI